MHNMLAIESSAALCSVALNLGNTLTVREQEGQRSHTQYMLALIDEVLRDRQCDIAALDAIVFAAGPGSFTGVRLAASVAKSLAYAAGIPVIPVSSLAAIAQTAARVTASLSPCLVISDARMDEVYLAEYAFDADGIAYAIQADRREALAQLQLHDFHSQRIAGDAAGLLHCQAYASGFQWITVAAHAQDLLLLGEQALQKGTQGTALSAQAIYLRDKTSWKNTSQQLAEKQQSLKS